MVSYAGFSMDYVKQYRCRTDDIITNDKGKLVTNNEKVNKELRNGDEIYDFLLQDVYIYDEQSGNLVKQ